jgi:outer membrane protein assembly factor BamB
LFRTNFGVTPLLVDGYLYGTDDPKTLMCVDYKTGKVMWKEKISATGQLTKADGLFYLFSEDGMLSLWNLSPEKATKVSEVKILPGQQRWAHPVIANGKLYVRDDAKLLCLDVTAK